MPPKGAIYSYESGLMALSQAILSRHPKHRDLSLDNSKTILELQRAVEQGAFGILIYEESTLLPTGFQYWISDNRCVALTLSPWKRIEKIPQHPLYTFEINTFGEVLKSAVDTLLDTPISGSI